ERQAPAWREHSPSWGLAFPATHLKLFRLKWVAGFLYAVFLISDYPFNQCYPCSISFFAE
ncbi:MAG: hypothetical protein Q7U38_02115, partial [Methylobacter sp.]|nr:hypothetical protein [Methylobacter sp.]